MSALITRNEPGDATGQTATTYTEPDFPAAECPPDFRSGGLEFPAAAPATHEVGVDSKGYNESCEQILSATDKSGTVSKVKQRECAPLRKSTRDLGICLPSKKTSKFPRKPDNASVILNASLSRVHTHTRTRDRDQ